MSIEFINVTKRFDDTIALDSISFKIERGTACGYVGPNGAGKTTTARIIVGLEKADSGTVRIAERDASSGLTEIQRTVGYVPESPKLYESLTPVETIAMAAMLRKYDKKKAIDKLGILSQIFLYKDFLRKQIGELSKGTRQKVVISLALVFDPSILILDEPTDGLDVRSVLSLKRVIKSFTTRGGTVFYSSHLLDVVEGVCAEAYFINRGRIAGEFKEEEFKGKRGYLENAFMESVGTGNEQEMIDALFQDSD